MSEEGLSPSSARERSFAYRSLMTSQEPVDFVEPVRDQLTTWLRQKKHWDVDTTEDGTHQDSGRTLEIVHHQASRSLRARLTERQPKTGVWRTELLASQLRDGGGWLALDVTNDRGNFVDVPVLARYLMEALPLGDGSLQFVDKAQIFYERDVDRLIDVLCDEQRHGVVFVAGSASEGLAFAPFATKVGDWTRQVRGLAQVIVLDPSATERLESEWGGSHATPAWTIRTYFPGVDPASESDARRHRILGTPRLAGLKDDRVRRLLGGVARLQGSLRREPAEVVRLRRVFERLDNHAIVTAIESPPPAPATESRATDDTASTPIHSHVADGEALAELAERYLAQVELVRSVFSLDVLDEPTLRRIAERASSPVPDTTAIARVSSQIMKQRDRIEHLEDELAEVQQSLEDDHLEKAVIQLDLDDANERIRFLQRRLIQTQDLESAYAEVPFDQRTDYPESFDELLVRLRDMKAQGIEFTGDARLTVSLTEHDTQGMAVRMAWDAVLALSDYVRARRNGECQKGVDDYIKNTPSGYRQIPPAKFASTETAATMQRYGAERIFPVPTDVDASARATMTAHFKLGRIGMVSPRLYFLDDYTRTGMIVIGYIGPHLTNTRTN